MNRTSQIDIDTDVNIAAGAPPARAPGVVGRLWARTLGRALKLSPAETRVASRGFQVDSTQVVQRLEAIGANFALGYNTAIGCTRLTQLTQALQRVAPAERGFAFEGAAMGLALTDGLTPGRRWFPAFVAGPASSHEYMAWVGLGWALARLPVSPAKALQPYRSINKWLALDGWGFHEGYFGWRRCIAQQRRPRSLDAAQAQVFDQGLGRSLWFVFGAGVEAIAQAIEAFEPQRRGDLWSGVGLACAYAGGAGRSGLQALRAHAAAADQGAALGQGVVFAAQARQRAENPTAHTGLACMEIIGLDLPEAAALAIQQLPSEGDDLATYQRWRAAIRVQCGRHFDRLSQREKLH